MLSDLSYTSHFKVIRKNLNLNRIDSVDVTLACEDGPIKAHKLPKTDKISFGEY
jgi:hypothetical protein